MDLGNNRVLPLIRFRGQVRPLLLAGTKSYVEKCLKEAEPYFPSLRERGVSGAQHGEGWGCSGCGLAGTGEHRSLAIRC